MGSRHTSHRICHFLCVHFQSSICWKRFLVLSWLLSHYINRKDTIIMGGRVIFGKMAVVDIFPVLQVDLLVGLPAKSKGFPFFYFSTLLVKFLKIVAIWWRFLFCVSQNNFRYRVFLPFPKCACFGCFCFWQIRFKNIKVVWLIFLESGIFGEGVAMGGVSPCGRRLIPTRYILFDGNGRIVEGKGYFFVRRSAGFGWMVSTHVHGGKVAFSLFCLFHFNFIYYYF